ncbi:TonB-dependent receptor [Terrimonas rubra]|uniref:TonB-dependent receptor n=1 Tax=Terrimonas rubra TaxID=1035890 RepID=A0ABW6A2Z5_9BACT
MRLLLLIAFWAMSAITLWAQDCTLRFSGHVEDADTKEKLSGAAVLIRGVNRQIVTDAKGDFVFTNLCAGTYEVVISHAGCETITQTIQLDKARHVDFFLPHARKELGDVVVTTQKGISTGSFKKTLSGTELDEVKGLSIADALGRINGVTLLQTGSNIAKPMIHGLHSSRILTINNGVRQEGQQWGNEHALEIDPFIADNLTIIKGVDELRYGSDAIGGVILVNPKALLHTPGYNAEFNTMYFTNNNAYVVSGMFEQQLKKLPAFSYRLQGTFKQGGNVAAPDYRLNNTGNREANFSVTAGWKKSNYNIETFYSQFFTKVGIFQGAHIGNVTDLLHAIEVGKPDAGFLGEKTYKIERPSQEVQHNLFKLKSTVKTGLSRWNFQFAAQFNKRKEYDVIRNSTSTQPQLTFGVLTLSEDISWEHRPWGNFQGVIGASAIQQNNWYTGRYLIPDYQSYSGGLYWIEKWSRHQWDVQGGLRFDYKTLSTKRYMFGGDTSAHDFNFSTMAGSLNGGYRLNNNGGRFNAGISVSSRAPHVNELLTDGVHHGSATYEQGDINLKTEKSVHVSLGYVWDNPNSKWSLDISLYHQRINDFIYQQPKPDEPVITIRGSFPLLVYQQTDATLQGIDVTAGYRLLPRLTLVGKTALLWARNRSIDDWLIGMPGHRVTGEIVYLLPDRGRFSKTDIRVEVPTVFKQTRMPDETIHGKQDYAMPPDGYTLLNVQANTTVMIGKVPVGFGVGAYNLLNQRYRDYLNSFRYYTDAQGTNINFRVKVPLQSIFKH